MAKSGLGCMPNSPNLGKSLETLGISKILLHITFLQGSAAVWPAVWPGHGPKIQDPGSYRILAFLILNNI